MTLIRRVQLRAARRKYSANCIFSEPAVVVIAGDISVDLLALEMKITFNRSKELQKAIIMVN